MPCRQTPLAFPTQHLVRRTYPPGGGTEIKFPFSLIGLSAEFLFTPQSRHFLDFLGVCGQGNIYGRWALRVVVVRCLKVMAVRRDNLVTI